MKKSKHGFPTDSIITDKVLLELSDDDIALMKNLERIPYLRFKLLKLRELIQRDGARDRFKEDYDESCKIEARLMYRNKAIDWVLAEINDWS